MAEPSGLRRGPGGPRGSQPPAPIAPSPGGAQRSQAAVPEPMVRAERRGLPGSPGGSRSTLPAPSLRRGCLADTQRLRGPKGDAPVAKHRRAQAEQGRDLAPLAPRWSLPQPLFEFWLSPAPTSPFRGFLGRGTPLPARPRVGQDCQSWSKAPEAAGRVRPVPKLRASTHTPAPTHPGVGGKPWPPSPRPLLALGRVTSWLLTLPAPSRVLLGFSRLQSLLQQRPGRAPGIGAARAAHTPGQAPPRPLPEGRLCLLDFN